MAYDFQVTFDCRSPHDLADWWAEALGWEVEPSDQAFIRSMVDQGYAEESDTTRHRGSLVWADGQAIVSPAEGGQAPRRVLFQRVPEEKSVKNRVHLDVRLGDDDREAVVSRLIDAGATFLHRGQQGRPG